MDDKAKLKLALNTLNDILEFEGDRISSSGIEIIEECLDIIKKGKYPKPQKTPTGINLLMKGVKNENIKS